MAIAIGLLKMLLELQQTRRTGALDVNGPSAHVRLFVENGSVVFADEGMVGETLGRILVRERVLTHEQYSAAIEWMADLRTAGKRARLGEVFVDLGLLTAGQVKAALAAQVQQKVMRALGWSTADFAFIESAGPLVIDDRYPTEIEPIVVSALRLAEREDVEALLDQARQRYVALACLAESRFGDGPTRLATLSRLDAFRLPPAEDDFARMLDGSRTVAELLEESGGGADRGVILAALLVTDVLDLTRGPLAPPTVDPARARAPAKPVKPPVPRPPASKPAAPRPPVPKAAASSPADDRAQVKKVTDHMRAAREVRRSLAPPPAIELTDADTPRAPTEPVRLAPLLAEKAYQAGKHLVRARRLTEAVVELRKAASLYPAVEYDLWAAWAEARCDSRSEPSHAVKLRGIAELAIAQDSERGFATFVLAYLAHRAGEHERAEELFARARALDPEAALDAWDVRLRVPATSPARGEVRSLAPLLTSPPSVRPPPVVDANANANANANERERSAPPAPGPAPDATPELDLDPDPDPDLDPDPDPDLAPASDPSLEATPFAPSPMRVLIIAALIIAALAVAYVVSRPSPSPSASPSLATSLTDPPASAPTSAPASPTLSSPDHAAPTSPDPAAPIDASYAARDATLPIVDATKGLLDLPASADGHRVYVDERMAGVPPPPITVTCGQHVIRVGSQGRDQTVHVPCGGSVTIAYP